MSLGAAILLGAFWFGSRYPALFSKAAHVGQALPSMTYSHALMQVNASAPIWERILAIAINWIDGMRIGMTFAVLFGALVHTVLRYYPLKLGNNLYFNAIKGAFVGIPAGVCANCSVPVACGLTRGQGKVEVALGFLFSSPNFNLVVLSMTFAALPLSMALTKCAILLFVIVIGVPTLLHRLERKKPFAELTPVAVAGESCAITRSPGRDCDERFTTVLGELGKAYGQHVWMLVKPTVALMLVGSVLSGVLLALVPLNSLLSTVTPLRMAAASLLSVFMPVPIALDVMFAAQLQHQGIPSGYVMMFLTTLGTYSIVPAVYLWREVSRPLAIALFGFFVAVGWVLGMLF
ncbi:MAG TPA: permease [Candidatus Saccharimonadales bacterium]|nr:permease [Candidatus Saccharimonadales bacterium]